MKNHTLHTEFSVSEIEISYRRNPSISREKLQSSREVVKLLSPFYESHMDHHECFRTLLLDRSHKVLGVHKISQGGVSGTVVDQRLIFQAAILANASAIILSHNHPSATLFPSEQDKRLTEKLKKSGTFLDIPILDHIILTSDGYFSFADEGYL